MTDFVPHMYISLRQKKKERKKKRGKEIILRIISLGYIDIKHFSIEI